MKTLVITAIITMIRIIKCDSNWIQEICDYYRNNEQAYQVLLVIDKYDNEIQSEFVKAIEAIVEKNPTAIVNLNEEPSPSPVKQHFSYFQHSKFIIFLLDDRSIQSDKYETLVMGWLSYYTKCIFKPSIVDPLPKILIIVRSNNHMKIHNLLKHLWTWILRHLDVSVLVVDGNRQALSIKNDTQSDATLHYYNPFLDKYITSNFSSREQLFPDKLQNLYGYTMKVGISSDDAGYFSPIIDAGLNYSFWYTGNSMSAEITFFFAAAMNFKVHIIEYEERRFQRINNDLESGALDYIGVFPNPRDDPSEWSNVQGQWLQPTHLIHSVGGCLVYPEQFAYNVQYGVDGLLIFVCSMCLIALILITSWYLNFDKRYWNITNVFYTLLGIPVVTFPRKQVERILLSSLLITSMLYSSEILERAANIYVSKHVSQEIRSLEDIDNSGLVPFVDKYAFDLYYYNTSKNRPALQNLIKKSLAQEDYSYNDSEILRDLILYNNVTVLLQRHLANKLMQICIERFDEEVVQCLDDDIPPTFLALSLKKFLPYYNRFNTLLLRLQGNGLTNIWWKRQTGREMFVFINDFINEVKGDAYKSYGILHSQNTLKWVLLVAFVISCGISVLVFFGELYVDHCGENHLLRLHCAMQLFVFYFNEMCYYVSSLCHRVRCVK